MPLLLAAAAECFKATCRSQCFPWGVAEYILFWHWRLSVMGVALCAQEEFEQELSLPLARMEYGSVGQTYVLLQRPPDSLSMGKLGANLQFTVKEIDPSSGMHPLPALYIFLQLRGYSERPQNAH